MSLQSKMFHGDIKLEAAAISDAAHITLNAIGEHVRKIQLALNLLDSAVINPDGKYGPSTALAVLAYKQKRSLVNHSYQTKADNIVGKMTIVALDRELLVREKISKKPIRIRRLFDRANITPSIESLGLRPALLLGFKIDIDVPVFPGGNLLKIKLKTRNTEELEILNGNGGQVMCKNLTPIGDCKAKTSFIYDPKEPNFLPKTRLNPEPSGLNIDPKDGGRIIVRTDPLIIKLDTFRPGDSLIEASTSTSFHPMLVEVRAPKLGPVPGTTLSKTRTGLKFLSSKDEPDPHGVSTGRPVNPIGNGRKINLGGETETPGFEDYSVNLPFSGFAKPFTGMKFVFRPWTEDTNVAVGVANGTASDICIRGTPVHDDTLFTIKRIASPQCRFTYGGPDPQFLPILKRELGVVGFKVIEEFSAKSELVMQRG